MLTKKDYCDYELRLGLRDIGYPMSTCQINNGPIQMPKITLYEAQKWLREEKKIGVFISGFIDGYTFWVNNLLNGDTLYQGFFDNQTGEKYKSYEDALSKGIKETVKILKENETIHE